MYGMHMDTVHRTGFKAEFTTRAFTLNHRMHAFGRAEYGVYRTGLKTQGAADADLLIDDRYHGGVLFFPHFLIQGDRVTSQKIGQGLYTGLTAWRTAIDFCLTMGNSLCIGSATREAALATLGLGKDCIDLIDDWVGLYLEAY